MGSDAVDTVGSEVMDHKETHSGRAVRRMKAERDEAQAVLAEVCAMFNARAAAGEKCSPADVPSTVSGLLSYADDADARAKGAETELVAVRQENECYASGYCARGEGKLAADCPEDVPRKAQQAWMAGWIAGDNADSLAALRKSIEEMPPAPRENNE